MKTLLGLLFLVAALTYSQTSFAKGSSFGLGLRAGMHVAPVPGVGLDFFYSAKDYTLGFTAATGSLDFQSALEAEEDATSTATLDSASVDAMLAMVEARYFLFWGVNISGGLGIRTINMELAASESTTGSSLRSKVETQSTVFNVGLGVMGRWDVFYLSLDLLGVTNASNGSAKVTSTYTGAGAESADLSELNDDLVEVGTELGNTNSIQLFNLGLGLMF